MLPLSLLNAAQGKPMLVELKNGVTFNGHLVECDNFMNVTLREVYQTSADGERFWKMKEMFIKGNIIKYFRIADSILDSAMEEQEKQRSANRQRGGAREVVDNRMREEAEVDNPDVEDHLDEEGDQAVVEVDPDEADEAGHEAVVEVHINKSPSYNPETPSPVD
ncbi:U6 snRNA-associated Sm-like protein LSm4 [Kwoniella heveanensis BCC8398]|uniref:LSM complex subunit LSM4 n=1 Tax=Kwoniella heveanensis BCC8398 TaxID=1296120 RepID=A0A1B9GPC2_9TREE|nr:U6 snRNA-associated Sm-like protein LSm4 [Kwoniella heveanensis BCC8398]